MRSWGGEPVVRWRSDAPFSTIAFSSCLRLTVVAVAFVAGASMGLVRRRDAGDLVEGAGPLADLGDAGHAQGAHATADGLGLDLDRGGALEHQLLDRLDHGHDLVDGDAALV